VPNAPSKEFVFLAETANLAAVDLLDSLLDSGDPEIRFQASMALSFRKETGSVDRFIKACAKTVPINRQDWKLLQTRVTPRLLEIVEDPRHPAFRGSLNLISTCWIVEGFPRLVRAAEQASSPHGGYAGKCLVELAVQLGSESRSGHYCPARESIVRLLGASLAEFSAHRSNAIAEALIVSATPDDAVLQGILRQHSDRSLKILVRLWKTTQRQEALDLLVQLCGRQFVPRSVLEILFQDRKDAKIAKSLAQVTSKGITSAILNRIKQSGSIACFLEAEKDASELDRIDRWQLWKLMAAGRIPIPKLFEGIGSILEDGSAEAQEFVADILRQYRSPGCRAILKAMAPSIAWDGEEILDSELSERIENGAKFRRHVQALVAIKDKGQEKLRRAVEEFFHDFTVTAFIEHLDILVEDALKCFAGILTLVNDNWHESLIPMMQSPVPKERCNAAIVAGYFGPHPALRTYLTKLLTDPFETIQEEASFALKQYPSTIPIPGNLMSNSSTASLTGLTT
jgi:hypothetical protein